MAKEPRRAVYGTLILSGSIAILYVFSCWRSCHPLGSAGTFKVLTTYALGGIGIAILGGALSVLFTIAGIPLEGIGTDRSTILPRLAFCGVASAVLFIAVVSGNHFKAQRLRETAKMGEALVVAIEKYVATHNASPVELEDLTPNYIGELPKKGVSSPLKYVFVKNDNPEKYNGNAWVLFISLNERTSTQEVIVFYPNQKYSEGSRLINSSVGSWALKEP